MSSHGSNKVTTVIATAGYGSDTMTEISYTETKVFGNGSFGVVFQAKLLENNEIVAIKKVLQDRRFKNRELQIMRKLKHVNIVKLKYFFYSSGEKRDEVYLNLVLEFMPDTLYKVERQYSRAKQILPINFVRLYMYQLFRALAYMHSQSICHRDIKPQNLLIDGESAVLKLCDFGSAKQLVTGETNVAYICSRYYRAPELIFGATNYTTKIDIWSAGCVLAELLLGQLIFPGDSGVDQIVEIVKVMGTPTPEQMTEMNPTYKAYKLPQLKPHPWQKVFRIRTPPDAIDLVSKLLLYTPNTRISPLMACAHPFFDELRQDPNQLLPNGRQLPPLFNFNDNELNIDPGIAPLLQPKNKDQRTQRNSAGADSQSEPSQANKQHVKINELNLIIPNSVGKLAKMPPQKHLPQGNSKATSSVALATTTSNVAGSGNGIGVNSDLARKLVNTKKIKEMGNGDGIGIGTNRPGLHGPAILIDDEDMDAEGAEENAEDDDDNDNDHEDDVDNNTDENGVDDINEDNDDDDDENEFDVNYSSYGSDV